MAGKQNLPSASDALRELGNYLVQCILFRCWYVLGVLFNGRFFSFIDSTFNIFNATLHDNMAVKLGYDFSLKCFFRSKSTNVFFSIKSRAKKRKTSSIELVLQKVNGRFPLYFRNLQDIFQTLQQQRLRLSWTTCPLSDVVQSLPTPAFILTSIS